MKRSSLIYSILAASFTLLSTLAHAEQPQTALAQSTFERTLPNGLKVIVREDHRAPTLVHMVWYRTGAIDEKSGTTGIAHMLEHMMFKGTKNVPAGEFNKRVAALGGQDNAFTTQDYTAYFQRAPANRLKELMELESDRMMNLDVKDELFQKERQVVTEERRWRTEDQPRSKVYEALMAATYTGHPYHNPVIGWMNDIQNYTAQDVQDWHDTWYTPNNAVVIVVGDVKHDEVFKLAADTYGKASARALPLRKTPDEAPQTGVRRVTVKAPAELPYLLLAWHVSTLTDIEKSRQAYALQVLSAVLDGYDGARLTRQLVNEKRRAVSVGAGYSPISRGRQSVFLLEGIPSKGVSVAQLEADLREQIKLIADKGISEAELKRVKAQLVASKVYEQDSQMGQAQQLGALEMLGFSWSDNERLYAQLRSVTAEEVKAAAKLMISTDTMTAADLVPLPINPKAPKAQAPATEY